MAELPSPESVLPHRPPFLFVDRIVELAPNKIVGVRTFRREEEFFKGHFPGRPVVPGVLLIEGLAQTMAYYALQRKQGSQVFLIGVERARFRSVVEPDTEVTYQVEVGDERHSTLSGRGTVLVKGKRVAEADVKGYSP